MKKYSEPKVLEALNKYINNTYVSRRQAALDYRISPAYMYYILTGERAIPEKMLADIGFKAHTERFYTRVSNGRE